MESVIITLPHLNDTFPNLSDDLIEREGYIDAIISELEEYDMIFINGKSGYGKTTLLAQFCKMNPYKCISHFVKPSIRMTYNPQCVEYNILNQIYFYCYEKQLEDAIQINLDSIALPFLRKINKNFKEGNKLYFVLDGFADISDNDLELLKPVFSNFPWKKAKFIFSGDTEKLLSILDLKLNVKSLGDLVKFSLLEATSFFMDVSGNTQENMKKIFKISNNGFPARLSHIKRKCKELGNIENFLNIDIDKNTDLFKFDWNKCIKEEDKEAIDLMSLLSFSDIQLTLQKISIILDFSIEKTLKIKDILNAFIEENNGFIDFISEAHKEFAKSRLAIHKDYMLNKLIEYYEKNPLETDSIFNLPNLYQNARAWGQLTSFLTIDMFIQMVEKSQSIGNIKKQFEYGYDASKHISENNFNGEYLRFALHKSSMKELEKAELWDSEVEARIALGEYERAYALAHSVLLKEDQLRLFAAIAKQRKKNNLPINTELLDIINSLYKQIDFSQEKEKGLEIAQLLMYTSFELSLDLVDKLTNNMNTSADQIYAYFSLFALEEGQKDEASIGNFDIISSKIKNDELKKMTNVLKLLSSKYDAKSLLDQVEKLNSNAKKLLLLRNWIEENKTRDDIYVVMTFALNLLISDSDKDTPNATVLSDIASPLPYIKDKDKVYELIRLLDSQKDIITTPTYDYVKLQLSIAVSLSRYQMNLASERIFDVYLYIDEISDLSIKTGCLALLLYELTQIDKDGEIECCITSNSTLEKILKEKIEELLHETAYHFRMTESVIEVLICDRPMFVKNIILLLNTQERRNKAYKLALIKYIKEKKFDSFDFILIKELYDSITIDKEKESVILVLIDRFCSEKNSAINYLTQLKVYFPQILFLSVLEERCLAFTKIIKILLFDEQNQQNCIDSIVSKLHEAWDIIDVPWRKIEIGFTIAKHLSSSLKNEAMEFLELSTKLKQEEKLSSSSAVNTYMLSTKLCLRAFGGLIKAKADTKEQLGFIDQIIGNINSYGEELKLWNKVALHYYSSGEKDKFDCVLRDYILILIQRLDKKDKAFYEHIVFQISPSIFLYNQTMFKDLIIEMDDDFKDSCISNIYDYICTKYCYEETLEEPIDGYDLRYDEFLDIINLMQMANEDLLLFTLVRKTAKSLDYNKGRSISFNQRKILIDKILATINYKLPNAKCIVHDGYLIACKASLLSLEPYQSKKKEWDLLIAEVDNIPNISDKAFVYILLSSEIKMNKKSLKVSLLEKGFSLTKSISSNYDKSNRFDVSLSEWLSIDKSLFSLHLKAAYVELMQNKDGSLNNIKNLIDVAQQNDKKLAEDLVAMLDNDPARRRYKAPILDRIDKYNRIELAKNNLKKIESLSTDEVDSLCNKCIIQLENGEITSRQIDETYPILEKISSLPLSDAYSLASYFIENVIKKQEINKSYTNILKSIFQAACQNVRLVGILSVDTISKMKKIYNFGINGNANNPIIRFGEVEKAKSFIKRWVYNNVKKELTIIDPYFTKNELQWLMMIKEVNKAITINILTSKLNGNNDDNNKEIYRLAWKKVSAEEPPLTSISIVWNSSDNKCPFHDRWWIADDVNAGIMLSSLSSLGKRDTQIIEMNDDSIDNVGNLIKDYIYKRVRNTNGFNLKYESFDLSE
nr:hypothetical protein [uncultured Bacteroides sp.]